MGAVMRLPEKLAIVTFVHFDVANQKCRSTRC